MESGSSFCILDFQNVRNFNPAFAFPKLCWKKIFIGFERLAYIKNMVFIIIIVIGVILQKKTLVMEQH